MPFQIFRLYSGGTVFTKAPRLLVTNMYDDAAPAQWLKTQRRYAETASLLVLGGPLGVPDLVVDSRILAGIARNLALGFNQGGGCGEELPEARQDCQ